jgi:hypothetical protein
MRESEERTLLDHGRLYKYDSRIPEISPDKDRWVVLNAGGALSARLKVKKDSLFSQDTFGISKKKCLSNTLIYS